MDIYDALHSDHEKLRRMLEKLETATELDEDTSELLHGVRNLLVPHSRAEEEVFYNSIRQCSPQNDIVMHGFREHMEAEALVHTLQGMSMVGLEWTAAAKKLRQAIEHHIREEEIHIFAAARRIFSEDEARQLGEAFIALKPECREEGMIRNALHMVLNLMPLRLRGSEHTVTHRSH